VRYELNKRTTGCVNERMVTEAYSVSATTGPHVARTRPHLFSTHPPLLLWLVHFPSWLLELRPHTAEFISESSRVPGFTHLVTGTESHVTADSGRIKLAAPIAEKVVSAGTLFYFILFSIIKILAAGRISRVHVKLVSVPALQLCLYYLVQPFAQVQYVGCTVESPLRSL